ncbi:MAG TPA: carboxypeptidase regulatory-like domain-containing protein [Bryobacteraceae bacterium]|nr:carboxypeptidase regulatory-like domain-containing protein [Bryobacteraceae bacterium]
MRTRTIFSTLFRFGTLAAALLVVAAVFPALLPAQAISGDLVGAITDATGAGVPQATVTATNDATGVKSIATADAAGGYRFANLPAGTYTLTTTAPGFTTTSIKAVQVQLNNTVTQNVTLAVGSTTTTVEVTDAAPPLDTTTSQLQATYSSREAEDLPVAGFSRSAGIASTIQSAAIWNLTLLGSGVASNGGVGQGTGPTVSGQRPENNTFFLDGVSDNNHYSTGPLAIVPNDAVAEVSMLQNQFSPEFGGASGGVFNAIVKSGTNSIHGSIYEYFQNRNLNADDSIYWTQGLTSFPRYDNNRLGATIGGPILKDKLFYFGNFEYNPIGQASVPGAPIFAPTSAGYSALAANPQVSSTNLGVLQKYVGTAATNNKAPLTVGNASIPIGSVAFVGPNYNNSYNAVTSIDYNMSEKDQLRGRWIYNRITGIDAFPVLPAFYVSQPNNTYSYSLSEFHTFTPTFQNEFRAAFSRNVSLVPAAPQTFPGMKIFPDIDVDPLNLQIGGGSTEPSGSVQNLLELQDNVTKVMGRHTIKFGYSFTDVILTNYFIQRVRGEYEYSTLQQYLYDLTPDVLGERSAGPSAYPTGFLENSAFVNDDFRLRPNLTLNLGLRYEYITMPIASRTQIYSAPANVPGVITFGKPSFSPNDWSPRVGFAYSPGKNNKTVIRGGFSRSFDLTYANLTANAAPAFYQTTQDVNLASNTPGFLANGALAGISPGLPTDTLTARSIIGSYVWGGKRPYGLTWTMGVQRLLGRNYTFEARYTGTKGVHMWNQTRLNIASLVNSSNYIPTFLTLPSAATLASLTKTLGDVSSYIVPGGTADLPFNQLASLGFQNNLVGYAPQSYSFYNGLALQLTKRYSHGFSYTVAYTWSHLLDDATATNFSTYLTPRRAQDFQDLRSEWASSALDRRHRFTFTPIYEWKPFRNGTWLMRNVVGNWMLSGTYTYQSPEYATVQSGLDSNLNNDSAGDRTVINPAGAANAGSGVTAYNALGQAVSMGDPSTVAYVANNANARYIVAGLGALANGGRNTFPLKPTDNIDLSISKRFNVTERIRFEIAGQFFNVLNHPQYTGGFLSDVAGSSQINSRNDMIPSNKLFGQFDQFYSSNSRFGQLVLKIVF